MSGPHAEPWEAMDVERPQVKIKAMIRDAHGAPVGEVYANHVDESIDLANAARIVACVNAMEGIEDVDKIVSDAKKWRSLGLRTATADRHRPIREGVRMTASPTPTPLTTQSCFEGKDEWDERMQGVWDCMSDGSRIEALSSIALDAIAAVRAAQAELAAARAALECERVSGTCVMVHDPERDPCTPDNCATIRAKIGEKAV